MIGLRVGDYDRWVPPEPEDQTKLAELEAEIAEAIEASVERVELARLLFNRARLLGRLRRFDESDTAFARAIAEYGGDQDDVVRGVVAGAVFSRGWVKRKRGDWAGALETFDEFLATWGGEPVFDGRPEMIASALKIRASLLVRLGRGDEAMVVWSSLLDRFGDVDSERVRRIAAETLVDEARFAFSTNRYEVAIESADEALAHYDDPTDPFLQRQIAAILRIQAFAMSALERRDDARRVCDQLLERSDVISAEALDDIRGDVIDLRASLVDDQAGSAAAVIAEFDHVLAIAQPAGGPKTEMQISRVRVRRFWFLIADSRFDEAAAETEALVARLPLESEPQPTVMSADLLRRVAKTWQGHPEIIERLGGRRFRAAVRLLDAGAARGWSLPLPPAMATRVELRHRCVRYATECYDAIDARLDGEAGPPLRAVWTSSELGRAGLLINSLQIAAGMRVLSRANRMNLDPATARVVAEKLRADGWRPTAAVYEFFAEIEDHQDGRLKAAARQLRRLRERGRPS